MNGTPLRVLLDSGATMSFLHVDAVKKFNLKKELSTIRAVTTAGGHSIDITASV